MCSSCDDELTVAQRRALELDEATVRVARSCGVIDLALGCTLARLFEGDLLLQLAFSRETDYVRERLGISPALAFSLVQLARGLRHRPLLRRAVSAGAVSCRKALAVLPLAVGDDEPAWTEAAMRLTLREIASAVRAAGKESPEERFEAEAIVLPMTPEQQDRLDAALSLAKDTIGPEARRWQCLEAICQEWFSSFGEWEGKGAGGKGDHDHDPPAPVAASRARILAKQLAAIEEAIDAVREIDREAPETRDALGLDARAMRLVAARHRYDETFGALAEQLQVWCRTLGYRSFEEYCEERLGASAGGVRQRIWLERKMRELPALREALASGRITYSKALLVARHATPFDIDERIQQAASTTWQQTERETAAEEERKNRGVGVRRTWAPSDAAQTVRDAIASAQAWSLGTRGQAIDGGEALAVIADHFMEVWTANRLPAQRSWVADLRRHVLMRKGGLCAVPGCSRAARHVHHIVYRSRGGKDTKENGVGLCMPHHLHGIHVGYLEVSGNAGERLHWKFGTREVVPLEEWVTFGDDDVRRADGPARASPGRSAGAAGGAAEFVAEGCAEDPRSPRGDPRDARDADRTWIVSCGQDSRPDDDRSEGRERCGREAEEDTMLAGHRPARLDVAVA